VEGDGTAGSSVEGRGIGKPTMDAQVLAGQRPDDDRDQSTEEDIHAQPLSFRLDAADQGSDEEPGRSHEVAIQKSPRCTCHVRVRLYGSHRDSGMP
jgi:hypothetical protein